MGSSCYLAFSSLAKNPVNREKVNTFHSKVFTFSVYSRHLSRSEAAELWQPIRLEIIEDPLPKPL
jgi:hypothetical protein